MTVGMATAMMRGRAAWAVHVAAAVVAAVPVVAAVALAAVVAVVVLHRHREPINQLLLVHQAPIVRLSIAFPSVGSIPSSFFSECLTNLACILMYFTVKFYVHSGCFAHIAYPMGIWTSIARPPVDDDSY